MSRLEDILMKNDARRREQILDEFQARRIALASQRVRLPARVKEAIELITSHYERERAASLPAQYFLEVTERFNPHVINRAKKLLGLKSQRIGYAWWWVGPPRNLDTIYRQLQQERYGRELAALADAEDKFRGEHLPVKQLAAVMEKRHWWGFATEVMEAMSPHPRRVVIRAKNALGIGSIKDGSGPWLWVWPTQPVQDWLFGSLKDGPVPVELLLTTAWERYRWHIQLIRAAKLVLGGIETVFVDGVQCWRRR